jgi:heme-degrading monooxygenase HmoA
MSIIMLMHWPEVSKAQYEQARKEINWEGDTPQGAKFHVAWFGEDGFHVLDLWESREDFERFLKQRLTPAVQKIGIQGQPKVQYANAHAVFAPNV